MKKKNKSRERFSVIIISIATLTIVTLAVLANEILWSKAHEDIGSGDRVCEEFEDNILWSSGYTSSSDGSTKYWTWIPKTTCVETGGQDCSLESISVYSRTIYAAPSLETSPEGTEATSYVQISNPDNSICDHPERGAYSIYLAYESMNSPEGQKEGWYCGYEKEETSINPKPKCGIKPNSSFTSNTRCYGIKAYASANTMTDVFKIKYRLCRDSPYDNNSDGKREGVEDE